MEGIMNYLGLVDQLISISSDNQDLASLSFAKEGLKKEKVNQLSEPDAQKLFVYYLRPYFIFRLYPSVYETGQWIRLTFDDYLRGINKKLKRTGKD